jgi:transcription termination factor Rho
MLPKKKAATKVAPDNQPNDYMADPYESKPIMPVNDDEMASNDMPAMSSTPDEEPEVQEPQEIDHVDAVEPSHRAPAQSQGTSQDDRLKEDLKISYPAKGILDVTFGGYGFLRHDYIINPDKDIYVSTSQIRRFWLRKGDEVEGLARPPKQGERFHSLILINKINDAELSETESQNRKDY